MLGKEILVQIIINVKLKKKTPEASVTRGGKIERAG